MVRAPALALALLAAIAGPLRAQVPPDEALLDRLFGAEADRPDTSRTDGARRDDLAIVGLRLGRFDLADGIPAYAAAAGLCLPLAPVLDALGLDHAAEDTAHRITLYQPERRIRIDLAAAGADVAGKRIDLAGQLIDSPEGTCLTLDGWARLLPVTARDDRANLRVQFDATEPIPVVARLERAEQRKYALVRVTERPDYPEVANPWRLFGPPAVDLLLDTRLEPGRAGLRGAIEAAGDLLWMTGRLRSALDPGGSASLRLTLERDLGDAPETMPLGLQRIALGDIAMPPQPLIGDGISGRGLLLASRGDLRPGLFDRIEIRGPLARSWEAELYKGEQLLAVVTEPDPLGDYVFPDVPLLFGDNRFEIRLYGPHGEREVRTLHRIVGADSHPENEVDYALALVDGGRPLFGPAIDGAFRGRLVSGSLAAGLSDSLSTKVDARLGLDSGEGAVALGLDASLLGGSAKLLLAADLDGDGAFAFAAGRRVGPLGVTASFARHGGVAPGFAPADTLALASRAEIAIDTRLPLGRRSLPVTAAWWRSDMRRGVVEDGLTLAGAVALGATRIGSSLETIRQKAPRGTARRTSGSVAVSRSGADWRLRGTLDYGFDGASPVIRQVAISSAARRFDLNLTGEASYGPQSGFGLSAAVERRIGPFSLNGGGGLSGSGWRVGAGLAVALAHDPARPGYRWAEPGISRAGVVRPTLFHDSDGDGLAGPGEARLAAGRFILGGSVRQAETDARGETVLGGLEPGRRVDLEPQIASIADIALRPARPGVAIRPRAGQLIDLPVPLVRTGEVEVRVVLRKGLREVPLAAVRVMLLDAADRPVRTVVSDHDGYAYFDGVPKGRFRLKADGVGAPGPLPVVIDEAGSPQLGLVMSFDPADSARFPAGPAATRQGGPPRPIHAPRVGPVAQQDRAAVS